jgi:hypothetical protein
MWLTVLGVRCFIVSAVIMSASIDYSWISSIYYHHSCREAIKYCCMGWREEHAEKLRFGGGGRGQRPSLLMSLKRRVRAAQPNRTTVLLCGKWAWRRIIIVILCALWHDDNRYNLLGGLNAKTGSFIFSFCTIRTHRINIFKRAFSVLYILSEAATVWQIFSFLGGKRSEKNASFQISPPMHLPSPPPILPLMKQS